MPSGGKNRLVELAEQATKADADLSKLLETLDCRDCEVKSAAEADAVLLLLEAVAKLEPTKSDRHPAHSIIALFQSVATKEAGRILFEKGMPILARIYDRQVQRDPKDRDLLFILKMFCGYQWEPGLDRLIGAARQGIMDGYLWVPAFRALAQRDGAGLRKVLNALKSPLPTGFCCVAFLDCANQAAREHGAVPHPFDTVAGRQRLREWLTSSEPDQFSYAHSATAALPYISLPDRTELIALAMDHPDVGVQIEAAWAAAKVGSESGIKMLARFCEDVNFADRARRYLRELGREDAVPDSMNDPDFVAMAQMSQWLAHPSEFGRPADKIELYDTREIFWPPANETRKVWLFKYTYKSQEQGKSDDVGLGMVGSVTFALFGETTSSMTPDEAYAVHCCWELQMNHDPRAPQKRTVEFGKKLLGFE